MNPIFIEYYSHEECDCYKIRLTSPFTRYLSETIVLCKVDEGYDKARDLAIEGLNKRINHLFSLPVSQSLDFEQD